MHIYIEKKRQRHNSSHGTLSRIVTRDTQVLRQKVSRILGAGRTTAALHLVVNDEVERRPDHLCPVLGGDQLAVHVEVNLDGRPVGLGPQLRENRPPRRRRGRVGHVGGLDL